MLYITRLGYNTHRGEPEGFCWIWVPKSELQRLRCFESCLIENLSDLIPNGMWFQPVYLAERKENNNDSPLHASDRADVYGLVRRNLGFHGCDHGGAKQSG